MNAKTKGIPRSLQEVASESNVSGWSEYVGPMALLALSILLIVLCWRHFNMRKPPSREIILEQQQRQRQLMRQAHIRAVGVQPVAALTEGDEEAAQLSVEEAEQKRAELLRWFSANNLQMKVTIEDFVFGNEDTCRVDSQFATDEGCQSAIRIRRNPSEVQDIVPSHCVICVDSYAEGETVVWSNNRGCSHCFHQDCALDYLVSLNKGAESPCPVCRQPYMLTYPHIDDL